MNLDTATIPNLAANGFEWALDGLEGQFLDDDLTLINLECTPSREGTRQDRPFNFRCDPDGLPEVRAKGVDLVNLTNNHAMDYGAEGLMDGLGRVRDAGLAGVGSVPDRAEAFAPAVLDVAGWKVAVLGFGGVYLAQNWLATDDRPGISDGLDIEAMTAAVTAIRDDVEIVFGHHQHRLQPMEQIGESVVFWGLGNFVWPRNSALSADTAVARVEVAPDGRLTGCLLDATIVSAGHPTLDKPEQTTC